MAYRKLEDTANKVIHAVQKLGAENGIKGVTVKKVSDLCDVSTFTVATCFGNMQGALDAAKKDFEVRYKEKVFKMIENKLTLEQMWDEVLDFYLEDPNGTVYYYEYNHFFGIDISDNNEALDEILKVSQSLFLSEKDISDKVYLLLWDFVTTAGQNYARRVIKGYLENTPENRNYVKKMTFGSLYDLF